MLYHLGDWVSTYKSEGNTNIETIAEVKMWLFLWVGYRPKVLGGEQVFEGGGSVDT